jgi:hypothetical protein
MDLFPWFPSTSCKKKIIASLIYALGIAGAMVASADGPAKQSHPLPKPQQLRIPDVSLSREGIFSGKVVNAQGRPIAKAEITFCQSNKVITKVSTYDQGDFYVSGLPPGVYQLFVSPNQVVTVRVWDGQTAPPSARSELLVVVNDLTVRGQRRIGELLPLESTVVVGGMVAAAIAIPIAIANSNDDVEPVSP